MSTDFKSLILSSLETMRLGEMAKKEPFKARAYKKAIDALKRFEGPIVRPEDIKNVEGVGAKIYEKISEIVATGGLKAAERMRETTQVGALETLLQVHGIGPAKARMLIDAGIRTIEDLRKAHAADPELLTEAQSLGLRYYEAGLQRIPRAEMTAHEAMLLGSLTGSLTGTREGTLTGTREGAREGTLSGTIVGSYRRGAADSGDVDMLVTYPVGMDDKAAQKLFQAFVAGLERKSYIVGKLAGGAKKWMGYVKLSADSVPRRLDLLLTPPSEFAYALFYFTGSDRFNVAFRRHCLDLGYTLNEHVMKATAKGEEKHVRTVPTMATEKDIFDFVGLRFVPPTERVDGRQIQVV